MTLRIWATVCVAAALVAALSTSGAMGVPPTSIGLGALAVVVALAAGLGFVRRSGRLTALATAVVLVALGLVGAQDHLRPGVSMGHDITYHAWSIWSLWRCVLDGDLYPRWNPYLALGVPLLQFYAPLTYLPAWPAQALGASPVQALAWLCALAQVGCAVTTYASMRWCGGSRAAGLLAAGAAVFAPYHLMDQTFRVALGETMAFVFFAPLAAAAYKTATGDGGRAPWVLGICLGGLLLTHVLSVITCTVLLVGPVLFALHRDGGRPAARTLAIAGGVTVAATAAWWLPLVVEVKHTSVSRIAPALSGVGRDGLALFEGFERTAWARYGVRRAADSEHAQGMPIYIGCLWIALVGLAATSKKRPVGPSPGWWAALAGLGFVLAVRPFAYVLDVTPGYGLAQYPWRLLGPASVFAGLAGGAALDGLPERSRGVAAAVALALLAWDASPFLGAGARWPDHDGLGLVALREDRVVDLEVDLPTDRFTRIEQARMPPSDYDARVGLSRRAYPEYMRPGLRADYAGGWSKEPPRSRSEELHVHYRLRWRSASVRVLDPWPFVAAEAGEGWTPDPAARWSRTPERVLVTLPDGREAGAVRLAEMWFPGWLVRVDDGAWAEARNAGDLLAADVPAGARTVEFVYSAWRPWDRGAGLLLSALTFAGLGFMGLRRRR